MTTQEIAFNLPKALEYIGGLGAPSKMPCRSWGIPVKACKMGGRLSKIENSICSKCYVKKGFYNFPKNISLYEKRLEAIYKPYWKEAMVVAIRETNESGFFRIFDSGDIQSVKHLKDIIWICEQLPEIKFWLPSQQHDFISRFIKEGGKIPDNLTIRLSAIMIDGPPKSLIAKKLGVQTSSVSKSNFTCPASLQNNKCMTCRACWDRNIENVTYKQH